MDQCSVHISYKFGFLEDLFRLDWLVGHRVLYLWMTQHGLLYLRPESKGDTDESYREVRLRIFKLNAIVFFFVFGRGGSPCQPCLNLRESTIFRVVQS